MLEKSREFLWTVEIFVERLLDHLSEKTLDRVQFFFGCMLALSALVFVGGMMPAILVQNQEMQLTMRYPGIQVIVSDEVNRQCLTGIGIGIASILPGFLFFWLLERVSDVLQDRRWRRKIHPDCPAR